MVVDLAHAWSPEAEVQVIGEIAVRTFSHSHAFAEFIEFCLYPGRQAHHGGSYKFPIYEILGAAAEEVSVLVAVADILLMFIAIAGISLIHIIISIRCLHHRRIVHIGKIPLRALCPGSHRCIIITIGRTFVISQFLCCLITRSWCRGWIHRNLRIITATAASYRQRTSQQKGKYMKLFHFSFRLVSFIIFFSEKRQTYGNVFPHRSCLIILFQKSLICDVHVSNACVLMQMKNWQMANRIPDEPSPW